MTYGVLPAIAAMPAWMYASRSKPWARIPLRTVCAPSTTNVNATTSQWALRIVGFMACDYGAVRENSARPRDTRR